MATPGKLPTEAQRAASRANGRLGGRPKKLAGPAEARRLRMKAREAGGNEAMVNLKFWISVRDDANLSMGERLRAAQEIEDRYGQPKQTMTISAPLDMDAQKLVDLTGFAPPPGWNGAEEQPSEQHTNGHANGNGDDGHVRDEEH